MARTKRSRRSYGAGEWGRNRVRIFPDPKTGIFQIEWRENGRRRTRTLKHRDWVRSQQHLLETLFDIYREEVTPTKANGPRGTNGPRRRCSLSSSADTASPRRPPAGSTRRDPLQPRRDHLRRMPRGLETHGPAPPVGRPGAVQSVVGIAGMGRRPASAPRSDRRGGHRLQDGLGRARIGQPIYGPEPHR